MENKNRTTFQHGPLIIRSVPALSLGCLFSLVLANPAHADEDEGGEESAKAKKNEKTIVSLDPLLGDKAWTMTSDAVEKLYKEFSFDSPEAFDTAWIAYMQSDQFD